MSGSGLILITHSRAFTTKALKVVNDVAKQRYTITMPEAEPAVIAYEAKGKNITWTTTNVPPAYQGKGVGKLLAQYAFDQAKENNLIVTCKCHFLAEYYKKNKEKYKSVVIHFDLE